MEQYKCEYELNTLKNIIINKLSTEMYNAKKNKSYLEIVFLCIGTDKITGDCFGPLVGSKLNQLLESYNIFNINIYGTLNKNVNYINIKEKRQVF